MSQTSVVPDGTRVREQRLKRGLTQAALAKTAGLSQNTVLAAERGNKPVSITTIHAIAHVLGCDHGILIRNEFDTRFSELGTEFREPGIETAHNSKCPRVISTRGFDSSTCAMIAHREQATLDSSETVWIAVDPSEYMTFREVVEDLFVDFIGQSVPPFSYGSNWILVGRETGRIIAPATWINHKKASLQEAVPDWFTSSPDSLGLTEGTTWEIRTLSSAVDEVVENSFMLACNNRELWELATRCKQSMSFVLGQIKKETIDSVSLTDFRYIGVFEGSTPLQVASGFAWVETNDGISEMLRNDLLKVNLE